MYFGNIPIHSVLTMDFGSENTTSELLRAFITNNIYFPDHLGAPLIRDKRNLALLRQLAIENKFSASDNELILSSIPWTVMVQDVNVKFKGQSHELLKLLREEKDQFVIKIANGFKGDSVYVGKFLSVSEWDEAIRESTNNEAFIAQEFCDSLNFVAPNIENQWVPHKLIWGAFGFGEAYGGVITRMVDIRKDDGVINSARGAVLGMVYESVN